MSHDGGRPAGEFLLYAAAEGQVRVSVYFEGETVWLTQKTMAEIFGVKVPAIAKHLKNILNSGELVESAVVSILETTASDGKSYKTNHYSLDACWGEVRRPDGRAVSDDAAERHPASHGHL